MIIICLFFITSLGILLGLYSFALNWAEKEDAKDEAKRLQKGLEGINPRCIPPVQYNLSKGRRDK